MRSQAKSVIYRNWNVNFHKSQRVKSGTTPEGENQTYFALNLTICLLTFSLTNARAWMVHCWWRSTMKHCLPVPRDVCKRPLTQMVWVAKDGSISPTGTRVRSINHANGWVRCRNLASAVDKVWRFLNDSKSPLKPV